MEIKQQMADEIRWHYRYKNFSRAFNLLSQSFEQDSFTELEREGVIQRFEYTFELAWKLLKDRLEHDGINLASTTPRAVIKEAFAAKLIADGDAWINMLTDRNKMSHVYNSEKFETVVCNIRAHYLTILGDIYEKLGAEMLD